jgi:4'-phosphopantetheinyl transferase
VVDKAFMNMAWPIPEGFPSLDEDVAHAWLAPLALPAAVREEVRGLLSDRERERAERFTYPGLLDRYVAAHGVLRLLLSGYLGEHPAGIELEEGLYGKPGLRAEEELGLHFNLSHTKGFALYAFCKRRALGVDLEEVRSFAGLKGLADRFFSPAEKECLNSLPEDEKSSAFFRCWTRKEAYLKARGDGLSVPLDKFSMALAQNEEPRMLSNDMDSSETARWSFHSFEPLPGYQAALAVEGSVRDVACWTWSAKLWVRASELL